MSDIRYVTEPPMSAEPTIDELIRRTDWWLEMGTDTGIARHLEKSWPSLKSHIANLMAECRTSAPIPHQQTSSSEIPNNCPQNTTQEK